MLLAFAIAPVSCSTEMAHLRSVWIAGRRSFVIGIEITPVPRRILQARRPFRAANTEQAVAVDMSTGTIIGFDEQQYCVGDPVRMIMIGGSPIISSISMHGFEGILSP